MPNRRSKSIPSPRTEKGSSGISVEEHVPLGEVHFQKAGIGFGKLAE